MALGAVVLSATSCKNGEREYDDYEKGTTVYFANQYAIRDIVLGNDEYDNSLDNAHKCAIYATMGGAYSGRNITLQVDVDNSLCNDLYFDDGTGVAGDPVKPMPADYYQLGSNSIPFNEMSNMMGHVEVQLTDKFFNDPAAIKSTYVVPLVIKSQVGADSILCGKPNSTTGAVRQDASAWSVLPKDYILYCVRYKNPWHASYIRRGIDNVNDNGTALTVERHDYTFGGEITADDEICSLTTENMKQARFPVSFKTTGTSVACDLLLTFNETKPDGECTISSATAGVSAQGTGKFVTKGAIKAWNEKDRDVIYLDYNVKFENENVTVSTKDTLVVRSRGTNQKLLFTPIYQKN
ncbi:MAG: DUF1735 domain-containing protein [Bacteroidaceae bacterium]|nr:DUF1735 domain-containing protein [Bacteroidaceae bacterium]